MTSEFWHEVIPTTTDHHAPKKAIRPFLPAVDGRVQRMWHSSHAPRDRRKAVGFAAVGRLLWLVGYGSHPSPQAAFPPGFLATSVPPFLKSFPFAPSAYPEPHSYTCDSPKGVIPFIILGLLFSLPSTIRLISDPGTAQQQPPPPLYTVRTLAFFIARGLHPCLPSSTRALLFTTPCPQPNQLMFSGLYSVSSRTQCVPILFSNIVRGSTAL